MQLSIDETKLDADIVGVKDSLEHGSAIRTLLFGETEGFEMEGVALKITREDVFLTVNGIDDADEVVQCQWRMNRPELIKMLLAVEGH